MVEKYLKLPDVIHYCLPNHWLYQLSLYS